MCHPKGCHLYFLIAKYDVVVVFGVVVDVDDVEADDHGHANWP